MKLQRRIEITAKREQGWIVDVYSPVLGLLASTHFLMFENIVKFLARAEDEGYDVRVIVR